jgi:[ribosomal protein S5]-alanine N-acetyltransferase
MRDVAVTRLITTDDAPVLAELYQANREFLAPWSPERRPGHFTVEGQRKAVADALVQRAKGTVLSHVILCDGVVVGRVTLSDITRGTFASCHLGYWLSQSHNGRGLATAAVGEMLGIAFGELGLHRVEAGTVPHNARSRAVLERNGFVRFGYAPAYLKIAGEWQGHILYQALNKTSVGGAGATSRSPLAAEAAEPGAQGAARADGAAARVVDAFYAIQRRFYAGETVDLELAEFLATDIAWHVPGRNVIAGDYRGRDEVMAYFRRRRDLADRSFLVTPRGTLADATRVVHFADGEAVLGGETRRWRTVGIFDVEQRRIIECWLVPFDQYAFDQIWAAR